MIPRTFLFFSALACLATAAPNATDWPTQRHDNRRSGATSASITLPLKEAWTHEAGTPRQAWSGPAKWDAYTSNNELQSMRNFDPCHHLTIAEGRVYFGSSVDDAVHCLDASNGKNIWTFFTNGPVRMPPTLSGDKAWFGSDDGFAYCLNAADGTEIWKKRAAPSPRLIASNGKMISAWPVRTGVLIEKGKAWFAGSLVPWEPSYLLCTDAATGASEGKGNFVTKQTEVTLQGAMLAGGDRLYVPQGRAAALSFKRTDGTKAGTIGHAGGVTCVLTESNQLISGPTSQKAAGDQVHLTDLSSGKSTATFNNTNRVTVAGNIAYLHTLAKLQALDLSASPKPRELWSVPHAAPVELIAAGSHLFVGLHNRVEIVDTATGKNLGTLAVDGAAHGLAVAAGTLFVSTDHGTIHAFKP